MKSQTILGLLLASLAARPATAEILRGTFPLVTTEEPQAVPDEPLPTTPPIAQGYVRATYNTTTNTLLLRFSAVGLSGSLLGVELHGLGGDQFDQNLGLLGHPDAPGRGARRPLLATGTLSTLAELQLLAGRLYVDINTDLNPEGEFRAFLSNSPELPEPATAGFLLSGIASVGLLRRRRAAH